ncbi:hypothetical protein BV20DRAFT_969588 [Pilatotrama ljubarskyi]|nr:hypothetical protein BV20DRAFT_969588 [Pilatotrama ljubarskyi]
MSTVVKFSTFLSAGVQHLMDLHTTSNTTPDRSAFSPRDTGCLPVPHSHSHFSSFFGRVRVGPGPSVLLLRVVS